MYVRLSEPTWIVLFVSPAFSAGDGQVTFPDPPLPVVPAVPLLPAAPPPVPPPPEPAVADVPPRPPRPPPPPAPAALVPPVPAVDPPEVPAIDPAAPVVPAVDDEPAAPAAPVVPPRPAVLLVPPLPVVPAVELEVPPVPVPPPSSDGEQAANMTSASTTSAKARILICVARMGETLRVRKRFGSQSRRFPKPAQKCASMPHSGGQRRTGPRPYAPLRQGMPLEHRPADAAIGRFRSP